jgi:hypothetical protein
MLRAPYVLFNERVIPNRLWACHLRAAVVTVLRIVQRAHDVNVMGKSEPDVGMLDSQIYWEWKVRMEDLLIYKDLWDYLSKDEADIQTPDEKRGDRKALSLVRSHVAQQYIPYIQTADHAKEAWDILSTLHSTSLGAKKSLLDQLTELTKEKSEDIATYCGRAQKLRLQLLQQENPAQMVPMYQTNLTVDRVLTHMQVAEERIYSVDKVIALKARTSSKPERDMS